MQGYDYNHVVISQAQSMNIYLSTTKQDEWTAALHWNEEQTSLH